MQAKIDGRLVKRAVLYQILHTRKNGSAVNPVVQAEIVSNFSIVVGINKIGIQETILQFFPTKLS